MKYFYEIPVAKLRKMEISTFRDLYQKAKDTISSSANPNIATVDNILALKSTESQKGSDMDSPTQNR